MKTTSPMFVMMKMAKNEDDPFYHALGGGPRDSIYSVKPLCSRPDWIDRHEDTRNHMLIPESEKCPRCMQVMNETGSLFGSAEVE